MLPTVERLMSVQYSVKDFLLVGDEEEVGGRLEMAWGREEMEGSGRGAEVDGRGAGVVWERTSIVGGPDLTVL